MPIQLVTPPAAEPVSLAEARAHLRMEVSDDDALISSLITAARMAAEGLMERSLITTRWKLVIDSFPGPSLLGVPYGRTFSLPDHAILLPRNPVSAVVGITYLDMAGTIQTVPTTDYVADLASEPARITPVFGRIWPINMPQIGSVQVTFDAGYGATADSVPDEIKAWMKLRVGSLYEHREEVALMNRGSIQALPFVDSLLDPYKVVRV